MKILLVDDDADSRHTLALLLQSAGHDVAEAPDGEVAMKLLTVSTPDFVLTDLVMPNLDGIAFIVKAKERGLLKCPVGVLSAYYPDREQVTGAVFTMRKPVDPSELESVLHKLAVEEK